jgi:hypothetical protein
MLLTEPLNTTALRYDVLNPPELKVRFLKAIFAAPLDSRTVQLLLVAVGPNSSVTSAGFPDSDWNVIVLTALLPVTPPSAICSVYVPGRALKITAPLTPLATRSLAAAAKLA